MSYVEEQLIKLQIELSEAKADRCKAVQLWHEAQGRVRELEAENALLHEASDGIDKINIKLGAELNRLEDKN